MVEKGETGKGSRAVRTACELGRSRCLLETANESVWLQLRSEGVTKWQEIQLTDKQQELNPEV